MVPINPLAFKTPARLRLGRAALAALLATPCAAVARAAEPVSFEREVMAVLSRAGCNQGVCHGNKNGKGGFRLSLRGQDPAKDHRALTRELGGRRCDLESPARSLILLKPTRQVAHEGGERFALGSPEHAILERWIEEGALDDSERRSDVVRLEVEPREATVVEPRAELRIRAVAVFADGERRDVTGLCVFEPSQPRISVSPDGRATGTAPVEGAVIVRYLGAQSAVRLAFVPGREAPAWPDLSPANAIDEHVFARLRELRIAPSPLCDDATFVRRAYLDIAGRAPSAAEAREFTADPRADKRERLVDELLGSDGFADFWALKWADLLRLEEKVLDRKGVQSFHRWIRDAIARGMPADELAAELLRARGSTYREPQANFYRAMRDPFTRAETAAQVFLGVRLQCARCHNHPFDRWTQDDYYSWAAIFARVNYKVIENRRQDENDGHEYVGEQVVWMDRKSEVENPRTRSAAPPRFLGAPPGLAFPEGDRLEALGRWIRSEGRHDFARVLANRVWSQLLGRGIVEPVDDFRASNPPSHPGLLEHLARELEEHGFDLRHLVRLIARSRTYQLSSVPQPGNADDEGHFARAEVVRLGAEQLLDSVAQVLDVSLRFDGYPQGLRAVQIPGVQATRGRGRRNAAPADLFLKQFGKPPRLIACDCERSQDSTLGQAFQLLSGPALHELLTRPDNRLRSLAAAELPAAEAVAELYWSALSRPPEPAELEAALGLIDSAPGRREALEDLAWSLLNAKEFLLRR